MREKLKKLHEHLCRFELQDGITEIGIPYIKVHKTAFISSRLGHEPGFSPVSTGLMMLHWLSVKSDEYLCRLPVMPIKSAKIVQVKTASYFRSSEHVAAEPAYEGTVQVQAFRRGKYRAQFRQNVDDFPDVLRPFKADEQACEVPVSGKRFLRHAACVKQEIPLPRLVALQAPFVREQQLAQVCGGFPCLAAVRALPQ